MNASSRYRYIVCTSDYLNESELPRINSRLTLILALTVAAILVTQPLTANPQTISTLDPSFGQTLLVLHEAESAGATPNEIRDLVALLNRALELNTEASRLTTPNQSQKRTDLLAESRQLLMTVQSQAILLKGLASQRTTNNTILAYLEGAVAAVLGTFAYAFLTSFYQKYRVKRTFQMRVVRK